MIVSLTGRVAVRAADHCVVEVAGVGYRLSMSTSSLAALPAVGDSVTVHTYMHVRPEEIALFGFESAGEKAVFEKLITVSGVGPRVALAALSTWTPSALADAIVGEDVAAVSSIPGVGRKTAQRIILDLKDKLSSSSAASATAPIVVGGAVSETRDALVAMGFSPAEVAAALKDIGSGSDAHELLRAALKRLGGGK